MPGLGIVGRTRRRPRKVPKIETATIRDFSGGWNVIDNDLNLSPRFAKELKNMYRKSDGSVGMRNGVRWFADITTTLASDIINLTYFADHLIVFCANGEAVSIDGTGSVTKIWDSTIAAALPGAPSGWSTTSFVSFAQFKGDLIVCNGIDKPLLIDEDIAVTYLQDLATGSNTNTPIGKYVTAVREWVIIAGVEDEEGTIYVSNTQTSGTWIGDPAPNDGTTKQIDSAVTEGASEIVGLAAFRNKLIVFFSDVAVVVGLGTFDDSGNHEIDIEDILPQFGCLGHRTVQNLGDDILFADVAGIPSFAQSAISETLDPDRASALIDPEIQAAFASINSTAQLNRMFSVYHRLEGQYMLFVPNGDTYAATTETRCFVYKRNRKLRINAWSEYRDWNWRAACRSALGRVFFAAARRIYVLGDDRFNDAFYSDLKDDRDSTWANSTAFSEDDLVWDDNEDQSYKCLVAHTSAGTGTFAQDRTNNPTYWEKYLGEDITFAFELPWADFDNRMHSKVLRHISLDTTGDSQFDMDAYIDNFVFDPSDGVTRIPVLSLDMVAGSSEGYGAGGQPYGGGRRATDERLWGYNTRFKIIKLRVSGASISTMGLNIIAISVSWALGPMYR